MRKYLLLSLFCLLVLPKIGYASIVINEIMYDATSTDTGHEWVEIYNNGTDSVDLSAYKFIENETKHGLTPTNETIIPAGGYAIISDNSAIFQTDFPSYSGVLFDSSFSLSNETGETIELWDGSATVDTVSYTPPTTSKEGKTLGLISGSWKLCNSTPGSVNEEYKTSSSGGGSGGNSGSGGNNEDDAEVTKKPIEKDERVVTLQILAPKIIEPKIETTFTPIAGTNKGEKFYAGKFVWNFGDGSTATYFNAKEVKHIYNYVGSYVMTVDYYESSLMQNPSATERNVIDVVKPSIIISGFGDINDPYIVLKNISEHETDLGNWILTNGNKSFIFPKNTIILQNKTLMIGSNVTGFNYFDLKNTVLKYPNNLIAYEYNSIKKYSNNIGLLTSSNKIPESKVLGAEINDDSPLQVVENDKIVNNISKDKTKVWIWILFVVLLVTAGVISFLIYKRPNKSNENEKDFEIIE